MKKNRLLVFITGLGGALEYYDFVIYGLLASVISQRFFPSNLIHIQLLKTYAIFALGYLARPLGGMYFGRKGDTQGRKAGFCTSMLLMGITTLGLGLLPTYSTIGIAAPLLLLVCRMLQGFAFGAEIPGMVTFLTEHVEKQKKSFYCCSALSGMSLGILAATVLMTLLHHLFSFKTFGLIGWRIPFILGGTAGIASYFIRKKTSETAVFLALNKPSQAKPILSLFKSHPKTILTGIGITLPSACIVMFSISFPTYMHVWKHIPLHTLYSIFTLGLCFSAITIPLFGKWADKLGYLRFLKQTLLSLCIIFPVIFYLLVTPTTIKLVIFIIAFQIAIAALSSSFLPLLAELFPADVRFSGTGICYNAAYCISGFFPAMLSLLGGTQYPMLYVSIFFSSLTGCVYLLSRRMSATCVGASI